MIGWFHRKVKRKNISDEFSQDILPLIDGATKDIQAVRRRCNRILDKDISELSIEDLRLHIENIKYTMNEVESGLLNCQNRINRELQ